jgi:pSer/pThr/pTyr-binding forkhead associated (FHA) protein
MARLILMTAEGTQSVELRPVNSLGRHPNNTIQLLDKIVSKEHCIIEHRGDHYVLRDLGSLNGTFVNNERVRGESGLKHGDDDFKAFINDWLLKIQKDGSWAKVWDATLGAAVESETPDAPEIGSVPGT